MINLYYDNIIEDVPAPNGAKEIALTDDARRVPHVANYRPESPIAKFNTFYFVMKAQKTVVKLHTGKPKFAKNLFYPIEINHSIYGWNRDWTNLLSARAKALIVKNKMRLLILAPRITGTRYFIRKLKIRIDELVESGIPRKNIHLVLGELNDVYRNMLDLKTVYGFDWWQVYSQLIFKVKTGQSSLHWLSHSDLELFNEPIPEFDIDNWNPKKVYNLVPSDGRDHDIALLLELIDKNAINDGYYTFDKSKYDLKRDLKIVYIDPRQSHFEKDNKTRIMKRIEEYDNKDDVNLNDTIFSILCENHEISAGTDYKQEIRSLATSYEIWKYIYIGHPFAVLGCADIIAYLNNQGYFTFNQMISQKYDSIYYPAKRSKEIVNNISYIKSLPEEQIKERIENIKPFLKKNKEKFLNRRMQGKFLELFVDMMYE